MVLAHSKILPSAYFSLGYQIEGTIDASQLEKAFAHVFEKNDPIQPSSTSSNGSNALDLAFLLEKQKASADDDHRKEQITKWLSHSEHTPHGSGFRALLLEISANRHLLLLQGNRAIFNHHSSKAWVSNLMRTYLFLVHGRDISTEKTINISGVPCVEAADNPSQDIWEPAEAIIWPGDLEASSQADDESFHFSKLPSDLVDRLELFCKSHNAALAEVLFASFLCLLHKYSQQNSLVAGGDFSNHRESGCSDHPSTHAFIQSAEFDANTSLNHLLTTAPKRLWLTNQSGEPPEGQDIQSLEKVNAFFSFEQKPSETYLVASSHWTPVMIPQGFSNQPLFLRVIQQDNRWLSFFEYHASAFSHTFVTRMANHWHHLLFQLLEYPNKSLHQLSLLDNQEQVLQKSWDPPSDDFSNCSSVHRLFEAQVAKTPEAPCIRFHQSIWSYQEVNQKANLLASHLVSQSIQPGTFVGLLASRGPEMVIGMLAVLKIGCAYVPMDPDAPISRLEFVLKDTQAEWVLVPNACLHLSQNIPVKTIAMEAIFEPSQNDAVDNFAIDGFSSLPAYIMYTSGTTGQPKGAVIQHQNIVRLAFNTNLADHQQGDVFVQSSSGAFDAATYEIWAPLLNGCLLVCIEKETFLDAKSFHQFMVTEGITHVFLTTGLFHAFVHTNPSMFQTLHTLLVGGEALDTALAQKVLQEGPPKRFANIYGPTENTTYSTFQILDEAILAKARAPIGWSIHHSTAFIVDRSGFRQPAGLEGELWVGGSGLASGYWNRPQLTAQKFVPNPVGDQPGERCYRTGDKAAHLSNGAIDFLGRLDHQVKLRGFRIELGEISHAITQIPGVREALVLLREDQPGDKRLVSYWLAGKNQPTPSKEDMIAQLTHHLPEYMIPNDWVLLAAFPLNVNGKIDRKALPSPNSSPQADHLEETNANLSPRNPIETKIWQLLESLDHPLPGGVEDSLEAAVIGEELTLLLSQTFGIEWDKNKYPQPISIARLSEHIFSELQKLLD